MKDFICHVRVVEDFFMLDRPGELNIEIEFLDGIFEGQIVRASVQKPEDDTE